MQYLTPDPDEHSTEEIIRSYHEHQGDIDIGPFWWKLLAAVTTVGPAAARRSKGRAFTAAARRIVAMDQVPTFRTRGAQPAHHVDQRCGGGNVGGFPRAAYGDRVRVREPYKDDLAHEALLPSLIASVVAYATLVSSGGAVVRFRGQHRFRARDIWWSALLGAGIGLIAIVFDITFRRVRCFSSPPHTTLAKYRSADSVPRYAASHS